MEERKYLDLQGLHLLWQRIATLYPRTEALPTLLDALDDPFVRQSVYNNDIEELEKRIGELQAATNAMEDGDTIIRDEENRIKTNIILDIDEQTKKLRLITSDKKTSLSEIDYSPFVKDGMLNSVSIVVIPDDETEEQTGKAPGTYIKFVFNTDAGKEAIYLDASEFINIYEGDDYISVIGDKIALNTTNLDTHIDGYLAKSSTILGITSRLQGHDTLIHALQVNVSDFETRVAKLEADFSAVDAKVTQIDQNVQGYGAKIADIETALESVPNTPITEQEINGLN